MTRLTTGLHPAFDELSAHADRTDLDAARSRVARHVARCMTCRSVVDEIRALGEAARGTAVPGAPEGMWARIERRMAESASGDATREGSPERAVALAVVDDQAPSAHAGTPSRSAPIVRRAVLGLVAVIAVLSGVMALDAHEPLAAATPRRLRTDLEFVQPGGAITLHYRPIPALAGQANVTVWMFAGDGRLRSHDPVLTRAGTLRRVSALEFTGTLAMPDSAPVAMFIAGDSTGDIMDRTELRAGQLPVTVLAADARGAPRLDALIAALGSGGGSSDHPTLMRWAARMRALYPSAPETWILGERYARRGVVDDIVKLFESRERHYYDWHDRLEHRTGLSEVTETMMANLGWELMDTARAEFWTTRLVQDHPDSRFASSLWIGRYRDVPDDSVATVLRAFEPIYVRAQPSNEALAQAVWLARRSGDSTLIRQWTRRADPRGMAWLLGGELWSLAGDTAGLSHVRSRLREALAEVDSEETSGPTLSGFSRNYAWYTRQRVRTRLAAVELVRGDATGAKAALDSIVREAETRPGCAAPETMRWRAEASRRLGLMTAARSDLAYVATTENWRQQIVADSAPALLGASFSRAAWDSALVQGKEEHRRCWADSRDARRRAGG